MYIYTEGGGFIYIFKLILVDIVFQGSILVQLKYRIRILFPHRRSISTRIAVSHSSPKHTIQIVLDKPYCQIQPSLVLVHLIFCVMPIWP